MNSLNHLIKQQNIDLVEKLKVRSVKWSMGHASIEEFLQLVQARSAKNEGSIPEALVMVFIFTFKICLSSLWCSRIFTNWEHAEVKDLRLALFQTTFTCFTFWIDTSQVIQQYPTILYIFNSKKPYLSETGCWTFVRSNPDETIKLGNWNHHY